METYSSGAQLFYELRCEVSMATLLYSDFGVWRKEGKGRFVVWKEMIMMR
jgi:hypothetical protein